MRAPGAVTGVFAIETRWTNWPTPPARTDPAPAEELHQRDQTQEDKPFGSKELRACFEQGAERFGWARRDPEPRSMREGRELVGWGVATGIWESMMMQTSAHAILTADGRLEVGNSTGDIGTGTYTILTQIAAGHARPADGGGDDEARRHAASRGADRGRLVTAASSGTAVMKACRDVGEQVFRLARQMDDSPLANVDFERVAFADGHIAVADDATRRVALVDVMRAAGVERLEATGQAAPDKDFNSQYEAYTHSAIFAEVKIDEELGQVP